MQAAHEFENAKLNLVQSIVEQAPDAIIFSDRDGAIQIWNRGAETVFGYAAAEVLGKSLDVIIPERLRHAHSEGFRRAVCLNDNGLPVPSSPDRPRMHCFSSPEFWIEHARH